MPQQTTELYQGSSLSFVVGPDFSVVGSDSAAELAGEVAPLEPQLHPLQLVPQGAHAPRIVTQHTQNLPALPLSTLTTLPCSILTYLTTQHTQKIAIQHCPCIVI